MADVRSLLRQQRAARRIDHPFAAYSDAGKLLCTLCREQIKAESLWEKHLLSEGHTQKARNNPASKPNEDAPTLHKRKLDPASTLNLEVEEGVRRKRSKHDIPLLTGVVFNGTAAAAAAATTQDEETPRSEGSNNTPDQPPSRGSNNSKDSLKTPPDVRRRASGTPSQGVEIQIASRPATPAHKDGGSAAASSGGYFPLLPSQTGVPTTPFPTRNPSTTTTNASASAAASSPAAEKSASAAAQVGGNKANVDESEWAAFEADIAAAAEPYAQDAVISAPAMTSEEAAAAKQAQAADNAERKAQADVDLEDEREEATRALEEEFDEMKGFEERVRKLKESREAILKKRRESYGQDQETGPSNGSLAEGNGAQNGIEEAAVEEEEDEDDDEDDEDDWDGFRFRMK